MKSKFGLSTEIKDILRTRFKLAKLSNNVDEMINKYFQDNGFENTDYFRALDEKNGVSTEALTFIEYGEGDIELNIISLDLAFSKIQQFIKSDDKPDWKMKSSKNSKYHCFLNDRSLCGKYYSNNEYVHSTESGIILSSPDIACKCCYEKWKKFYSIY